MLKTNCKIVNERIKAFIISVYNMDAEQDYLNYAVNGIVKTSGSEKDFKNICRNINECFKSYCKGDNRKMPYVDIFSEWLSGLPNIINSSEWYYISDTSAAEILTNILEYTEEQKEKYCSDDLKCCEFLDRLIYKYISKY